ncbi:MAG: bifunctional diguanylate cyclase/phosphodiesterase [Lachnospiraceae bacterium]|nr:bifunctional diguanylate cyclase/phosphodiesterase [Lachnospiraceae bacterium]
MTGMSSNNIPNVLPDLKTDLGFFLVEHPYFILRIVIVLLLFTASVIFFSYRKYKAYIHMATDIDGITGLINWERFKSELKVKLTKNQGKKYALIHFDIDKFKTVNDVYGTSGGNRILRAIATDIKALLNSGEIASRVYADVFCLFVEYESDEQLIERVTEFNKAVKNCSVTFKLNAYFGIYKIEDEIQIDIMSDRANLAKQSIKGSSVYYYAFFDKKIRDKLIREKSIENSMHAALEAGEFVPYLQPQYSTRTGKIASAEALVRWNDPTSNNQVVSPGEFIDLFERNKFILKLDSYIWEEICKLLRKWIDEEKEPITISVNVSPIHFTNGDLVNEIADIVTAYNIPPHLIELEITESTFVEDKENVIDIIDKLHQLGFKIAMDDFGSGYSSLNMLNILPVDVLKIDKDFIQGTSVDDRGRIVIKNIIKMAKELNMTVITEGVENREQLEFLAETECDKIQGYYYSKPLPVHDFEHKYYS